MDDVCSLNTTYIYQTEELSSLSYKIVSWAIVTIILPTMAVFGVSFNALFLFVVFRVPEMRTVTNLFLVQLSVCDTSTLSLLTLRYLVSFLMSPEYEFVTGTSAVCTAFDFFSYFTYFVGVFLIFAVSIERYMAICKPLYYHVIKSYSRASKMALTCWVAGFILAIPGLVPYNEVTSCAIIPSASQTTSGNDTWMVFESCAPSCIICYHLFLAFDTIQFVIVFLCNSIMYYAIIKTLRKRSSEFSETSGMTAFQQASERVEKAISRMLVINGVAFFFFLGPWEVWNVIYLINEYTGIMIVSENGFYWLGFIYRLASPANFAINPLIYGASNPRYRKALLEAFRFSSSKNKKIVKTHDLNTISSAV